MLTFERRYVFQAKLMLTTALHIGGGRGTGAPTDSPVIRGPDLKPFIPGSSLKGSFRATVEKLAPAAGARTCALTEDGACPGAPGRTQDKFNQDKENWGEPQLIAELERRLCDTCKLFGSPFQASKIAFDDLALCDWAGTTQVRDGVAIDRDSERARDRLKYDYEVVPAGSVFDCRVTLEEPSDNDLGLTCVGMCEFVSGFGGIGGIRSRGLGKCVLEDFQVYELDLRDKSTRAKRLAKYLLGKTLGDKMVLLLDANAFLEQWITNLLAKVTGHAQTSAD